MLIQDYNFTSFCSTRTYRSIHVGCEKAGLTVQKTHNKTITITITITITTMKVMVLFY